MKWLVSILQVAAVSSFAIQRSSLSPSPSSSTTICRSTTTRLALSPTSTSTSTSTSTTATTSTTDDDKAAAASVADHQHHKTEFDLKAYFAEKLPAIEKALQESVVSVEPETKKIVESMMYSLMAGGKRIRPVLCLAAAEMFSPAEEVAAKAMPAAVALEMIHTMSLIHDDLPSMDNDDLRRGKPTNHVVYGEDVAILAGDALLSTAFQHVAENTSSSVDPTRILDVVIRLGKSVGPKGLAGGQVMDLECEAKSDASLDELRWIHTHKTATLLQVAVASGAILGGASATEVAACEEFALNIGLAFQVADDILDVTQSTEALGKTAGKDEATDKTTYPKLLGMDGARAEAERLVNNAKTALAPFGDRATPLLALADYIIDRKN